MVLAIRQCIELSDLFISVTQAVHDLFWKTDNMGLLLQRLLEDCLKRQQRMSTRVTWCLSLSYFLAADDRFPLDASTFEFEA